MLAKGETVGDLLVSTGMASLAEIEAALGVIAYGYTSNKKESPSRESFCSAYASAEGQDGDGGLCRAQGDMFDMWSTCSILKAGEWHYWASEGTPAVGRVISW